MPTRKQTLQDLYARLYHDNLNGFRVAVSYNITYRGEQETYETIEDFLYSLRKSDGLTLEEVEYLEYGVSNADGNVSDAADEVRQEILNSLEQYIEEEASDEEDAA